MSSLLTELGIDKLTPAERVRLISEIWDSLPEPPPPELSEEVAQELQRRIALLEDDPTALRPWAEVEHRIRQRLRP